LLHDHHQAHTELPTLWKESTDMYSAMELLLPTLHARPAVPAPGLAGFSTTSLYEQARLDMQGLVIADGAEAAPPPPSSSSSSSSSPSSLLLQAETEGVAVITSRVEWWLERGLAQHYFSFGDRGQKMFQTAREAAGLEVRLTAAMGKRTKHQRQDYAQLFLYAHSSLTASAAADSQASGSEAAAAAAAAAAVAVAVVPKLVEKPSPNAPAGEGEGGGGGWQHAEWELGRRLVCYAIVSVVLPFHYYCYLLHE
jgi:hypothetical protein